MLCSPSISRIPSSADEQGGKVHVQFVFSDSSFSFLYNSFLDFFLRENSFLEFAAHVLFSSIFCNNILLLS